MVHTRAPPREGLPVSTWFLIAGGIVAVIVLLAASGVFNERDRSSYREGYDIGSRYGQTVGAKPNDIGIQTFCAAEAMSAEGGQESIAASAVDQNDYKDGCIDGVHNALKAR